VVEAGFLSFLLVPPSSTVSNRITIEVDVRNGTFGELDDQSSVALSQEIERGFRFADFTVGRPFDDDLLELIGLLLSVGEHWQ
jgi:hypothetical protein